ncbi:MAG: DUF374 domain-containing protein [Planctomycetota bacterium]
MDRLRREGRGYVYAMLHAHQIAGCMYGDRGAVAMVSRSDDGAILVPTLEIFGKTAIRGSSGTGRKGGAAALVEMIRAAKSGRAAVIAADGPKGPRGKIQPGAALCAQKAKVPIVPVIIVPNRRWIMSKTWDRMQIPKPFTCIHFYFGDPIEVDAQADLKDIIGSLEATLHKIEHQYDPKERPEPFGEEQRRLKAA